MEIGFYLKIAMIKNSCCYMNSCSSEGDEDEEPEIKAQRERERRQANNARERYIELNGS